MMCFWRGKPPDCCPPLSRYLQQPDPLSLLHTRGVKSTCSQIFVSMSYPTTDTRKGDSREVSQPLRVSLAASTPVWLHTNCQTHSNMASDNLSDAFQSGIRQLVRRIPIWLQTTCQTHSNLASDNLSDAFQSGFRQPVRRIPIWHQTTCQTHSSLASDYLSDALQSGFRLLVKRTTVWL